MTIETACDMRVVLLDDETVSQAGLVAILEGDASISIVATAATLKETREAIERTRPDVVVATISRLIVPTSLEELVGHVGHSTHVLLLVAEDPDLAMSREAMRVGAVGLISKHNGAAAIRGAVQAAHAGAAVFPRSLPSAHARPPSSRERQIIAAVADGRTNGEIAAALGLSTRTIASHLRRCFTRYKVSSRTELAMLALHEQWRFEPAGLDQPSLDRVQS